MLNEAQIRQALHDSRVVPVPLANPHGPLGLEQLPETVSRLVQIGQTVERFQRPIALPLATREKLDQLARAVSPADAPCKSVGVLGLSGQDQWN
jgi:hypothetical protein